MGKIVLEQEKDQIDKQLTFLIPGAAATYLPEEVKQACTLKVSQSLTEHLNTMLQFTPDQILTSISEGRAVIALGERLEVVGFAQLWQYGFNADGQQILEFGSWLSFRSGCGERLLKEAVFLGNKANPKAQIVAIVEEENFKAKAILQRVGAEEIGSKFSPAIRTVEGEAAFMKVFDISNITYELSEREMQTIQKIEEFSMISHQIDNYQAQKMWVPEEIFQRHRILDYWLCVNYPAWKSRYGYPSRANSSIIKLINP